MKTETKENKGCGKKKWNSSNNERGKAGGYICGKRMLCSECVKRGRGE